MSISSVGIAETWAVLRAGATEQAMRLSMLKMQLDSQGAVLKLLQDVAAAPVGPPPGPGQGAQVDTRV